MGFDLNDILGNFTGMLNSGPANAAGWMAKYGSAVGEFFGWVDPSIKNGIDFARELQLYTTKRATGTDVANSAVKDLVEGLVVSHLKKQGWSSQMATISGAILSTLAGWGASHFGLTETLGKGVDKIGNKLKNSGVAPSDDDNNIVPPGGNKTVSAFQKALMGN